MKIISVIENGLSLPHNRNFNPKQKALVEDFLQDHDKYLNKFTFVNSRDTGDAETERWEIDLGDNVLVYIDCSVPKPWGASEGKNYYSRVVMVGFDLGGNNFYLP